MLHLNLNFINNFYSFSLKIKKIFSFFVHRFLFFIKKKLIVSSLFFITKNKKKYCMFFNFFTNYKLSPLKMKFR